MRTPKATTGLTRKVDADGTSGTLTSAWYRQFGGVKDGITERVAYVNENEPGADAVQRMLNEGFSQLPVLSTKYLGESEPYTDEIVGMITEQSILRSGEEVNTAKVAEMMEGVPEIISIHEERKDLMKRFERRQAVL